MLHPHPQLFLPFFLSFISLAIISATIAARTIQIIIVARFSDNHDSINTDFLSKVLCRDDKLFYFSRELCCFFIRSYKHIDDTCKSKECKDKTHNIYIACEEKTELVNHKSDYVCKATLVTDCEPSPFCRVHLSFDSADSRKAG